VHGNKALFLLAIYDLLLLIFSLDVILVFAEFGLKYYFYKKQKLTTKPLGIIINHFNDYLKKNCDALKKIIWQDRKVIYLS